MSIYEQIIRYGHYFIFSIKKYKVVFVLSLLVGFAPFIYKYIGSSRAYESTFTVAYDELVRKIYGDRLNKINALVQQKDYKKAASFLGISPSDASKLVSVQGRNIVGEELSKDMNTDRIPFIVRFVVKDSSKIGIIQTGIVNFLEWGNDYMAGRSKMKIREIDEEIAYIEGQMRVMDSIKGKYLSERVETVTAPNATTPSYSSIFQFSYELYKKRQDLLRKKEMPGTIQVVDDAIVSRSTGGPLLKILVFGTALGMFIYLGSILFLIPMLNYKEPEGPEMN